MNGNHPAHRTSECDEIRDLIPDYAFGLTDGEQTRLVEANLRDCPDAAQQLEDFRHLQTGLRLDVPQMTPPARLERNLMAAIASPAPVVKPRRRPGSWRWSAAAAAVILTLVVTNLYCLGRVYDLTQREKALTALLSSQQNVSSGDQSQLAFILTSTSGLRWVRLPPSQQNGDASAFLMWNAESKIGLMYARGFPKLSAGTTYQLWLTRGNDRVSVGTFVVDADGKAALLFNCADPIDHYTWARITVEPTNGSQTPTGTPIVVGELST